MENSHFLSTLHKTADKFAWSKRLLSRPIHDHAFFSEVSRRASLFTVDGARLGLELRPGTCFDMGGPRPEDSLVGALLVPSEGLNRLLAERVFADGGEFASEAMLAVYKRFNATLTRKLRMPVFDCYEFILVSAFRQGRSLSLFMIANDQLNTVAYFKVGDQVGRKAAAPNPLLTELALPRYRGLYSYVPVYGSEGWQAARYAPEAYLPGGRCTCGHLRPSRQRQVCRLVALADETSIGAAYMGASLNAPENAHALRQVRSLLAQHTVPSAAPQPMSREGACDSVVGAGMVAGYVGVYKLGMGEIALNPTPVGIGVGLIIGILGSIAVTAWGFIAEDQVCVPLSPPRSSNDDDNNDDTALASLDPGDDAPDGNGSDGDGGGTDGMGDAGNGEDGGNGDHGGGGGKAPFEQDPFMLS